MTSGVIITLIICATLVILAIIGNNDKSSNSNNKSDYYMNKIIKYLAKIDHVIERNATGISIFGSHDYYYKGIKQKVEIERKKYMEDLK